jgi:hypothetical protein
MNMDYRPASVSALPANKLMSKKSLRNSTGMGALRMRIPDPRERSEEKTKREL